MAVEINKMLTQRRRGALKALAAGTLLALTLTGCSTIGDMFGSSDDDERIEGERISVLALERRLEADPRIASLQVKLPRPYRNDDWPQPGGFSGHSMQHLALGDTVERLWRADAGVGSDSDRRLVASPVTGGGRVYVVDAEAQVHAFNFETGDRVWSVELTPENEDAEEGFGGGVAYDNERVFVTTGFGFMVALDAASGEEIWRSARGVPFFAAPTADSGRVFAVTEENELHAFDQSDGRVLWTHQAITEAAGILASTSPAVAGEIIVAPFSSGELFALRVSNGQVLWSDSLTRTGRMTSLSALSDIAGRPVIDNDRVLAVSHSGRFVSIDLRTGERVWTRNIAGVQMPWVAGEFVYLLSSDSEVLCLTRRDGRIRWITQLPRFEDPDDKEDPIEWSGPVLAGDRLIVVSSDGYATALSPYTGDPLGEIDLPEGTFIPPIVAKETVFLLTDQADLIALR